MNEPNKTTINPPPHHADKQWHWARHEGDDKWFVFDARDGRMWNGPGHMGAGYAYSIGWRYVGPAEPPGVPSRIDHLRIVMMECCDSIRDQDDMGALRMLEVALNDR